MRPEDAFEGEMKRRLTQQQQDRLIAGAPFADGGELDEVAAFMRALPAAVSAEPDPVLSAGLVSHLADTARASKAQADVGPPITTRAGRRRPLSRRALVARVAVAVALIPACMAGLAFAGVTVPQSARQVFDDVGVTLPNQPTDTDESSGGESGSEGAAPAQQPGGKAKAKGKNGQPGKSGHSHGKAKGHSKGNGHGGSNGNAGGNSANAPGHTKAGGSSNGNGGGSSGKTPPGQAKKQTPSASHGKAKGHSK